MLDPETWQKIDPIVKEFKESPNFDHQDLFDVMSGDGSRAISDDYLDDDVCIDSIEDSLLNWFIKQFI